LSHGEERDAMPTTVCQQAVLELERTRGNVTRWWQLLYAFGVAVTIFSILLIIALIWGNSPSKALSGLAAIASGAGVAFVSRQKTAAVKEHDDAKRALKPACGSSRSLAGDVPAATPDEIVEILAR
jgi:hypothetical protein